MAIEFVDAPPTPTRGPSRFDHQAIATELRARPGEWALVIRGASSTTARQMRCGQLLAYQPAGTFETTWRHHEGPRQVGDIYARYVGEVAG